MTSERAFANKSTIRMEVPRSRLPYERFRVDVALRVGREVGPFVSDGIESTVSMCRMDAYSTQFSEAI